VLSSVDPTAITTYQIEATPRTIQGNAVLVPTIRGDNMQAILSVFRGEATLAEIPDQVFETTTVPPGTETTSPAPSDTAGPTPTAPPTATTLPSVTADQNVFGVVPDKNVTC
jgi:hypothetical protein